ncbi:4-hydroxybenzoate transporter [Klebsiella pneumoniae]|uniref:4-hydroxybenzoate transporter n=1 Tax=Klebsiella pneumoniae TaxID=573 RepID=A0A378AVB2_KLEPN|nr:4-hydroxybenzoate transporter [Klebsiella pneumoniae]
MTQIQRLDVRELINRNPLSRFQKLIIFLGFCVIALDGFDIAIMGFIAPTLKLEWGVSNHQLGLVISAALIGLALGAIFSGPLADWLGRKKIIINSVFFFGFWTIATAFSHNVEQMMFFRFMTGLGLGAAMPNIGTLVSEYAPERQRSFIITVIFCGFTFGAAAGGFSASWLIPQFGWHSLMALGGILPLLFAPLLIWLLPESVRFLVIKQAPAARIRAILNRLYPGQISDNVRFILPAQPAAGNAMRIVLSRQYGFGSLMLWLVYFMGLFLVYILGSWLPTLVKAVGMTVSQAAIMTAILPGGRHPRLVVCRLADGQDQPPSRAGDNLRRWRPVHHGDGLRRGQLCLALYAGVYQRRLPERREYRHERPLRPLLPYAGAGDGLQLDARRRRIGAILSAFAGAEMMALNLPFESVFLILGIPAALTVAGLAAKGIFAAGHPPVASTSPASVRGAS